MFDEIKNIKTTQKDFRNFGIIMGIALFVISGILYYKDIESFIIIIYVGAVLLSFGLILPIILKPFYLVWMTFAIILGWFMTRFILGLLFYFIISPIGLFARIVHKNFLDLSYRSTNNSYWNVRDSNKERNQDYEKQY